MSLAPLGYLDAAGQRAASVLPLTWLTLIISVVACVIIAALLCVGVRRARAHGGAEQTRATPIESGASGLRWITVGLTISAVPLLLTLVWTMVALAEISAQPAHSGLMLDVSAHQWWWEVKYDAASPEQQFSTSNEIYIPVGIKVLVRLQGADVIHSFWIPKLSGKTDTIPGQTNYSWLEAQQPGRYRGQCGEYCGAQHAHMGLEVVAESQADFDRWRAHQLEAAVEPTTAQQIRGRALVEYRCGLCHRVRGTQAGAVSAPDLTHLMTRKTIAAGTLPNTPDTLVAWIQSPQDFKPGNLMPDQHLSAQQLMDVRAYLETLH